MSPVDNLIENTLLFCAASVKIYAGGFDVFMAENIREHGNIAAALNEIFSK